MERISGSGAPLAPRLSRSISGEGEHRVLRIRPPRTAGAVTFHRLCPPARPQFPARSSAAALLQEMSFFLLVHFSRISGDARDHGVAHWRPLRRGRSGVTCFSAPPLAELDLTHRRIVLLVTGLLNAAVVLALAFTTVWGPLLWGCPMQRSRSPSSTMLTYGRIRSSVGYRT